MWLRQDESRSAEDLIACHGCAGLTSLPAGLDASPAPRGIDVRLGLQQVDHPLIFTLLRRSQPKDGL